MFKAQSRGVLLEEVHGCISKVSVNRSSPVRNSCASHIKYEDHAVHAYCWHMENCRILIKEDAILSILLKSLQLTHFEGDRIPDHVPQSWLFEQCTEIVQVNWLLFG